MAKLYFVQNGAMQTTAPPVKQPTGTATRTMLQLAPAATSPAKVRAWGCSFDGSAAATPGQVELITTDTVFCSGLTAFGVNDIMPWNDPNAPANTAGSTGVPFNLGAALSAYFASGNTLTEGSIAAPVRTFDLEMLSPTAPYAYSFPLGSEPEVAAGKCLRVRMTFAVSVNAYTWALLEV